MLAGIVGAALFYGDGVITPAISVLSAVEGLEVATPALKAYVIPITIGVLIALFVFPAQGHGRHRRPVRAGHAGLVRHPGAAGDRQYPGPSRA